MLVFSGFAQELIKKDFLKVSVDDFSQKFKVCGSTPPMIDAVIAHLKKTGAKKV